MIRFLPDTWWEALLRPVAMAAPDANVYVEFMAPDLRFVFAALLAGALVWRRPAQGHRAALVLLLLVAASFIPWLATSGNGRYFLPILLLAGPLCVGLAYRLPWSMPARAATAAVMVALQALVVFDVNPWRSWSLVAWRDAPYFELRIPSDVAAAPATFVTITSISYSLVYPQFHSASRWMNLSAMPQDPATSVEAAKAQATLAGPGPRFIFVPTVPAQMTPILQPNAEIKQVINQHLGPYRLALEDSKPCRLLRSRTAVALATGRAEQTRPETVERVGFWLCELRYPVRFQWQGDPLPQEIESVFEQIERACPRFFPHNEADSRRVGDGFLRIYASTDMKVYVLGDGIAYYKYWRALNPQRIGSVAEILADPARIGCPQIRGRSGLPWQRSL